MKKLIWSLFLLTFFLGVANSTFGQTFNYTSPSSSFSVDIFVSHPCDGQENGYIEFTVLSASGGALNISIFGPRSQGPIRRISVGNTWRFDDNGNGLPFGNETDTPPYDLFMSDDDDAISTPLDSYDPLNLYALSDITITDNTTVDNTSCISPNGTIDFTVGGGSLDIGYDLNYTITANNGLPELPFSGSTDGSAIDISTVIGASGLPGGTYTITVDDPNSICGATNSFTIQDPVIDIYNIVTPSSITVCENEDVILDLDGSQVPPAPEQVEYTIKVNGALVGSTMVVGTGNAISLTLPSGSFNNGDVLTIEADNANCQEVDMNGSVVVNIEPLSIPDFVYDGTPYCITDANPLPTFINGGVAGTFTSSSASLVIDSSTGEIDLSSSVAGTYTITNTIAATATCPEVFYTFDVTITEPPVADFEYSSASYCNSDTDPSVTFLNGGISGTFTASSGGLVIDASTGTIDLSASTGGTYVVTNTIAAAGGCPVVTYDFTVNIEESAVPDFMYDGTPYCITDANPLPTFLNGGVAGTFTSSSVSLVIDSSTGEIDLSSSVAGTYTITNTIAATATCPEVFYTFDVTITEPPLADFEYSSASYCNSDTDPSVTFLNGGIAGTFTASSGGLVIDASTGTIDLSASTGGTYVVTNTIAAAGGCPVVTYDFTVNIEESAVPDFMYDGTPYCITDANPLPTFINGGVAGTFTSSSASLVIDSSTGEIDLSSSVAGTYTITNTIAATATCPEVFYTFDVTITEPPVADFEYSSASYCNSDTDPSVTFLNGGIAGTFTASSGGLVIDASTGTIDLSASTGGTYVVTNTIAAAGGCPVVTYDFTVNIEESAVPDFMYDGTPYCITDANPLPTFLNGGVAGTFTSSSASLVIDSSTGEIDLSSSVAGTYTITNTIAATATCPETSFNSTVIIEDEVVADFQYTQSTYCNSDTDPSPQFINGGVAGTFTASTGGLVINASSGLIDLSASAAGNYTVTNTVTGTGACGNDVETFALTIEAAPVADFMYDKTSYCSSDINPSPTFINGGVAGTFTSTPGLSINASTGEIDLANSTPGAYTITNTIAASGSCSEVSYNYSIQIQDAPVADFEYAETAYCTSDTNPTPTFINGGTGGVFSSTSGLVIDATSGVIDLTLSSPGNYIVTNTILASGACSQIDATFSITIQAAPIADFEYSNSPYCLGGGNEAPTFINGGVAGTFTSSSGLILNSTTGEVDLANSLSGTYTVRNTINGTGACGVVFYETSITLQAAPIAEFNYSDAQYCQGAADPSPIYSTGGSAGTFTAVPGGLSINGATGTIDLSASAVGSYTVTNTISATTTCPEESHSITVEVIASPIADFEYASSPYCIDAANPVPNFINGGVAGVFSADAGVTIDAASGEIDLSTSSPGVYNVVNTISSTGTCSDVIYTTTVEISSPISAEFEYTKIQYCQGETDPTPIVINGGQLGSFSSTSGLVIDASTGTIDLSASTVGNYTITNTVAGNGTCSGNTFTFDIEIIPSPVADYNYSQSQYCQSDADPSPNFINGGIAGVFSSTSGLSIDASGVIDLSASVPGTYIITNTVNSGGTCPSSSYDFTVEIISSPKADFQFAETIYCLGGANPVPSFINGGVAGTFTASGGLSVNSATGEVDLSSAVAGNYTITNTVGASGACPTAVASFDIEIINAPVADFTYTEIQYCQSAIDPSPNFINGGVAGTFTSTSGLVIDPSTGDIDLSASTPGNYVVENTVNGGATCNDVTASFSIEILSAPVADFLYDDSPYCLGAGTNPVPTFINNGVAGTFSADGGLIINSTTGEVDLAANAAGTYEVKNTIAASGSCPGVEYTFTIELINSPVADFEYAQAQYCQSETDPTPSFINSGVAGTFTSSSGLVIDSNSGLIDLSASSAGTYTVTNTIAANSTCPLVSFDFTIEILGNPIADFEYAQLQYCQSDIDPLPSFINNGEAGIFTSTSGLVIDASTGEVDLSASNVGVYTVTNTVTGTGTCPDAIYTFDIEINSSPIADFEYSQNQYCQSDTDPAPVFINGGVSGSFSSSAGLSINNATGVIDLASSTPGIYAVINSLPANGTCNASSYSYTVEIIGTPSAEFDYSDSPFCLGGTNPSPNFNNGGIAGTFTADGLGLNINPTTGEIDLNTSTAGTYTITNTVSGTAGCPAVDYSFTVELISSPVADFEYAANQYCQSDVDPSPNFINGGVGGVFTSTTGLSLDTNTGVIDLSASDVGTYVITNTINASGTCPEVSYQYTVEVITSPVADFEYSEATLCAGGTNQLPVFLNDGIAGTFTAIPAGLSIDGATGEIDLAASSIGSYTVSNTVAGAGSCADAVYNFNVEIISAPVADFEYAQAQYCQSEANPLPNFINGGQAGVFTSTTGLVIDGSTGEVDLSSSTPGTYIVTNTIPATSSCNEVSYTFNIEVLTSPVADFNYDNSVYCLGGVNPSPVYVNSGVAGVFSSTSGLILNSATGEIDLSASTAGVYTITNTVISGGGCPDAVSSFEVTLQAQPSAEFSYASSTYCNNDSNPVPTFINGGAAGTFTSGAGLIVNSSTGEIDLINSTPGTYTVTNTVAANGACNQASFDFVITIDQESVADFEYNDNEFCNAAGTIDPVYLNGGVAGTFTVSPAGIAIDATTGQIDLASSTAGSYIVTNTVLGNGGCSDDIEQFAIDIYDAVQVDAGADQTICEGDIVTLNGTIGGSASATNWNTSGDGTFANGANLSTTYTPGANDIINGSVLLTLVTDDPSGPCLADSSSMTVTIDRVIVDAGNDQTICTDGVAVLSGQVSGIVTTGLWTTSGDGSFDDPNNANATYTPGASDIATTTVTLTLTSDTPSNGCPGNSDDLLVTISDVGATADAGDNGITCTYEPFDFASRVNISTASDYSTLLWTTDGAGTFSDAGALNPIYTPAVSDGGKTLNFTLSALTNGSCPDAVSTMTIDVNNPQGVPDIYTFLTWQAYVYDNSGSPFPPFPSFDIADYRGYVTSVDMGSYNVNSSYDNASDQFDLNLGTDPIEGNNVCGSYADDFALSFKMTKSLTAGLYRFTIGADDGVKFFRRRMGQPATREEITLDKINSTDLDPDVEHPYTTYTALLCIESGAYDYELQYFEGDQLSRISFAYELLNVNATLVDSTHPSTCSATDGSITIRFEDLGTGVFDVLYEDVNNVTQTLSSQTVNLDTLIITNLNAGVYNNIRVNVSNCTTLGDVDVTLSDPASPILSISSFNDPTSCGANDGQINLSLINVSDGNYDFNYTNASNDVITISNVPVVSGEAQILGLSAGTYNDIILAIGACVSNDVDVILNNPAAPSITAISKTDPTDCGLQDGSLELTVANLSDGLYDINYKDALDDPQIISDVNLTGGSVIINGLPAGEYNEITIQSGSCVSGEDISEILVDPVPYSISITDLQDPSSCGANDGELEFTITNLLDGVYDFDYVDGASNIATIPAVQVTSGIARVTGLGAGAYNNITLTVGNCTTNDNLNVFLSDPVPFSISFDNKIDPSVCGATDGQIQLQLSNVPDGNYDFMYDDAAGSTQTIVGVDVNTGSALLIGLASGEYNNIRITIGACTNNDLVNVTLDSPVSFNLTLAGSSNPSSCGVNDGSILLDLTNVPDGTYDFDYIDDNNNAQTITGVVVNANQAELTGLSAGIYNNITLTIAGCTSIEDISVELTSSAAISITFDGKTDPTSCTNADGSIQLSFNNVGDGIYDLDYVDQNANPMVFNSVSIASGLALIDNLPAGEYNNISLTIGSCSTVEDIDVTLIAPVTFTLSALVQDITSCGGSDGAIDLTVTGGSGNYSYTWTGPAFTASTEDLATLSNFGNYTVTVTDINTGCSDSETYLVSRPGGCGGTGCGAFTKIEPIAVRPTCENNDKGSLSFDIEGGSGTYFVEMFDTQGNPFSSQATKPSLVVFDNLSPETYTYTVRDVITGELCDDGRSYKLAPKTTVVAEIVSGSIVGPECYGDASGRVTVRVTSGGNAPYYYAVNGSPIAGTLAGSEFEYTGLIPGDTQISLLIGDDANDPCPFELLVDLQNANPQIDFDADVTGVSACNSVDGVIAVQYPPTGGTGTGWEIAIAEAFGFPTNYRPFNTASDGVFEQLASGLYTVYIRDNIGCEVTKDYDLVAPNEVNISISDVQDPNCSGSGANGGFAISASGVPGPFVLIVTEGNDDSDIIYQDNDYDGSREVLTGLYAGIYNITVDPSSNAYCPSKVTQSLNGGPNQVSFDYNLICANAENNSFDLLLSDIQGSSDPTELFTLEVLDRNTNVAIFSPPAFSPNLDNEKLFEDLTILNANAEYILRLSQFQSTCPDPIVYRHPENLLVPGRLTAHIGNETSSLPDRYTGSFDVLNFSGGIPAYLTRIELDSAALPGQSFITDYDTVRVNSNFDYVMGYNEIPAGRYKVEVTDESGCVIVLDALVPLNTDIFIPNIFTPNNDGKNDVFYIRNLPDEDVQLIISNRWGKELYRDENYQNNWDGGELSDGVYFYKVDTGEGVYNGWIEILRGQQP